MLYRILDFMFKCILAGSIVIAFFAMAFIFFFGFMAIFALV